MFQRSAARPLALTAALLLFPACDSGDSDGTSTDTDADASTSGETTGGASTTDPGTTTGTGTTTDPGTTTDESSTGSDESSSGSESGSSGSESGSSSSGGDAVGIADVAGTYIETYGKGKNDFQTHDVTASDWTIDFGMGIGVMTYEEIDDEARWVAGNDGAGTYTRYDWDLDGDGNLRYCAAVFGAETLEDAIDAAPSDRGDFDGVGCAGTFPWSLLILEE